MSVTGGLIDTLERLGVHRPTVVAEKNRASELYQYGLSATKSDIIVRAQTNNEGMLSFY